jgi:hypothetical protein
VHPIDAFSCDNSTELKTRVQFYCSTVAHLFKFLRSHEDPVIKEKFLKLNLKPGWLHILKNDGSLVESVDVKLTLEKCLQEE